MEFNKIESFGKDHWSLLALVENLIVDAPNNIANIPRNRMRCNGDSHPNHSHMSSWNPNWGTRLQGYFTDGEKNKDFLLPIHDDWDCLLDLQEAELIEIVSFNNAFIEMTKKGNEIASQLRAFKSTGGQFAQFSIDS